MCPETEELKKEIESLVKKQDAIILAHNYQRPSVQDIAHHVGDSLGLSRIAARAESEVIVFCGVRFMAETASILSPDKTVLLPAPEAGCPLADMATAGQIRAWRARHPDAMVVSYVNTTAAVKAESDICCTSANACLVVDSIGDNREILFVPDRNLGHYVGEELDRELTLWDGWCPTHLSFSPMDVAVCRREHPKATLMVHPECNPRVLQMADKVAGTSGMVRYADGCSSNEFIVGTENGMIHRLEKEYREKKFYAGTEHFICPPMKLTTLSRIRATLRDMKPEIQISKETEHKASEPLKAMCSTGT